MKQLFKKSLPCATEKTSNSPTAPRPSSTRWGRKIALIVLLFVSIYWCWLKISNPATFPIRSVKIIDANNRVDHQALRQVVSPFLRNGMLWLDSANLQHALAQIPWVAQVNLKRDWPDELVILIVEQQPIAHWNNNELLNSNGDIFNPGTNDIANDNLPWLNGPPNQQNLAWDGYQQMNHLLAPLGLQISEVFLSDRQSWQIELNNGMSLILGRDQVLQRLMRFISVYPSIFANRADQLSYIDLRYSNGFAVKWKNIPPKTLQYNKNSL